MARKLPKDAVTIQKRAAASLRSSDHSGAFGTSRPGRWHGDAARYVLSAEGAVCQSAKQIGLLAHRPTWLKFRKYSNSIAIFLSNAWANSSIDTNCLLLQATTCNLLAPAVILWMNDSFGRNVSAV
jgi:hypothetical protein